MTILISIIWSICALVYFGTMFVFPMIVNSQNKKQQRTSKENDYIQLLCTIFFEAISIIASKLSYLIFIAYYLSNERFLGRRKAMIFSFLVATIGIGASHFYSINYTLWFVAVVRAMYMIIWSILYAYTPELYSTEIRSTAVGIASLFCRISGASMPWVVTLLYNINFRMPLNLFAGLSFLGAIFSYLIKKETAGVPLDIQDNNTSFGEYEEMEVISPTRLDTNSKKSLNI